MGKWKLVPVKSTKEMWEAGNACGGRGYPDEHTACWEHWDAMVAAAPRASEDEALIEQMAKALHEAEWGENSWHNVMLEGRVALKKRIRSMLASLGTAP